MVARRYIHSRAVDFAKWQALGNDYLIVESPDLPFTLTESRIQALCAPHTGVGSEGVLLLSEADAPEAQARLQIFNPDGSEAELSGNGAREALLYLHRTRFPDRDELAVMTAAGLIKGRVTSPSTARMDLGTVRVQSDDYPGGPPDGRGELDAGGRTWTFQHVQVGNPQCAIALEEASTLHALDLPQLGPAIEAHRLFPNRTNVSWYSESVPGRIRTRIFERGVGETSASGTGATGAAVAYVLAGGSSPVTVELDGGELEVEVGEDLRVNLTGSAAPVFAGTLADDFLKELHATE